MNEEDCIRLAALFNKRKAIQAAVNAGAVKVKIDVLPTGPLSKKDRGVVQEALQRLPVSDLLLLYQQSVEHEIIAMGGSIPKASCVQPPPPPPPLWPTRLVREGDAPEPVPDNPRR